MLTEDMLRKALVKFNQIPLIRDDSRQSTEVLKIASDGPDNVQMDRIGLLKDDLLRAGVKFRTDCHYLFIISLGAGEYYGPNLKADYYNEGRCKFSIPEPEKGRPSEVLLEKGIKDTHHTFKGAGIYRHHLYDTPSLGKVVWERYNPTMHWGEVIAELPHKLWDKDIDRYNKGVPLMWSQGSTCPLDICSRCAHVFSRMNMVRCDHWRNQRLQIPPDGVQVVALSPNSSFYEMSNVGIRPADKVSICLQKVAADGPVGAEAFSASLNYPRPYLSTFASIPARHLKREVIRKMAEMEDRLELNPMAAEDAISAFCLTEEEICKVASALRPLEWTEMLPATRSMGCMLTPRVFHAILAPNESGTAPDVGGFEEALRSSYRNIEASGNMGDILDDTAYSSLIFPQTLSVRSSIEPVSHLISLNPEIAAVRAAVRQKTPRRMAVIKMAAEPGPAEAYMAREYIKYQVERLAERGTDTDRFLAAACNRATIIED